VIDIQKLNISIAKKEKSWLERPPRVLLELFDRGLRKELGVQSPTIQPMENIDYLYSFLLGP